LVAEFGTALVDQTPVAAFTPDGASLLYPDTGDVVRRHPLDVDELVCRARRLLSRGPTPEELDRLARHGSRWSMEHTSRPPG
jgi:hypothetical protein